MNLVVCYFYCFYVFIREEDGDGSQDKSECDVSDFESDDGGSDGAQDESGFNFNYSQRGRGYEQKEVSKEIRDERDRKEEARKAGIEEIESKQCHNFMAFSDKDKDKELDGTPTTTPSVNRRGRNVPYRICGMLKDKDKDKDKDKHTEKEKEEGDVIMDDDI